MKLGVRGALATLSQALSGWLGWLTCPHWLTGCFVEDILQNWKDKYELLEDNHSYIQW